MNKNVSNSIFHVAIPAVILLFLSMAIRIPYLHLVPPWSAGNENFLALEILQGHRPLTNQNPHLGALSPYIIASAFAITGVNPWTPRLVFLIFGLATVLLTWRLGSLTGSRRSGFLAGVLMSAAWYHVVFTSHFPWSNSLTPFFTMAFLSVFYCVIKERTHPLSKSGALVLFLAAGLLFGLGTQTHPEMITLLPAVILLMAVRDRHPVKWLRSKAPWLMALGGIVGYGNMIWYNILHRGRSVSFGLSYPEYALTKEYTATSVAENYWQEFLYLPRIILGFWDDAIPWSEYARYGVLWLFWLFVLVGTVISWRRKQYLVPAAFWSMFLIVPAINSNYTLHLGRYLVFMFPTALILVSEALNLGMSLKTPVRLARISKLVFVCLFALLFLIPVFRIKDYYRHCEITGKTRERYFFLADLLKTSILKNPLVLLDEDTRETSDFHHFLRENRFECHVVKFKDARKQGADLKEFVARSIQVKGNENLDGIILILSPSTRRFVLSQYPDSAFLGQIDARFENAIADFYRVYQINS